jgi:hypothetical protein
MYDKNSECFELVINIILLEIIKVMFNTLKYDYFIIRVADCRMESLHHNLRSWNELRSLFGNKAYTIPIFVVVIT